MVVCLFTDFGSADIYVGQVKAVLSEQAPEAAVIDLLHDAPAFNIPAGAHLLAALLPRTPARSVTIAVVDPGVGGPRRPVAVRLGERWVVGPDNGLLSVAAARAGRVDVHPISWRPPQLSKSFHGRDLFAPFAAMLATNALSMPGRQPCAALDVDLGGEDLAEIIYIDHYGNAMTGLRASEIPSHTSFSIGSRTVHHAPVFSSVPQGSVFWYANSLGLVEFAANRVSAADRLNIAVGAQVDAVT